MENNKFRNFLLLVICILCLSPIFFSCLSDKALVDKAKERGLWPTSKDSIRIKDSTAIKWRDSSRAIPEKDGGEVVFEFGDNCDSIKKAFAMLQKNPITHKQNGITETISVKGNSIVFNSKEDAYKLKLDSAYEIIEVYKSRWEEIVKLEKPICPLPHKTKYTHCAEPGFPLLILLILLYIGFKTRSWLRKVFT